MAWQIFTDCASTTAEGGVRMDMGAAVALADASGLDLEVQADLWRAALAGAWRGIRGGD